MSAAVGEARAATDLWMCNYDMHSNHFIDFPILIREALVQHSVSFADDVRCGAKGGARLDEAVKCTRIGNPQKAQRFRNRGKTGERNTIFKPKITKNANIWPWRSRNKQNSTKITPSNFQTQQSKPAAGIMKTNTE